MRKQLAVCRKYNIRALAYTCVSWNEDWADRHPEWLTIPNNKDYQKILQAEYREIFDLYHPDGFWIDIVQGKHCVCETCSEEMWGTGP